MDLLLEATYRAQERHFWFRGFRRFVTPLVARAASGRHGLTLLDCGCGTGVNLPLLERRGRAFGFDLTWRGLEFARAHGAARVARGDVTRIPFPDGRFDVATSFDVLQTLDAAQARAGLVEMHRVLKPGGALILTVAALESLRGNHSVLAEEVHRYTRRELRDAVTAAGFAVERLTFTNATLFPLVYAVRALQRRAGLKPPEEADAEITVPAAPLNAVLSAVLAVEAAVVARVDMPIGSSLLCLARKR